jgi:hypothetical protein
VTELIQKSDAENFARIFVRDREQFESNQKLARTKNIIAPQSATHEPQSRFAKTPARPLRGAR